MGGSKVTRGRAGEGRGMICTVLAPRSWLACGVAMVFGGVSKACSSSGFCRDRGPGADQCKTFCRHAAHWRIYVGWACGDASSSVWGCWGGAGLVAAIGLSSERYSGMGVRVGRGPVPLVGADFCGRPVEAWWNGRVEAELKAGWRPGQRLRMIQWRWRPGRRPLFI